MTREEMIAKVGAEIAARYRLLNSEFEDDALLVEVGKSELCTPIRVFRPAMEADIRIGVGSVAPHGCMGWSGGAKILYPGITSADIVSEFHVMQGLHKEILFGMTEAPTRLAVERWTERIGLHFIVNTVLDADMKPYCAVAAHYVQAQRAAVFRAREICGVSVRERPDVILASAYPIYMDFWQCGKATYGASSVIKKGGELLLLAACSEGVGPHRRMLDYMALENGEAELRRRLDRRETGEDLLTLAVGVSMGRVVRGSRMTLITDGLTPQECAAGLMAHSPVDDLQKTLEAALARFDDPFLLILPEGGEAVPQLEPA
jgi:nickel-dependent lactate racemase